MRAMERLNRVTAARLSVPALSSEHQLVRLVPHTPHADRIGVRRFQAQRTERAILLRVVPTLERVHRWEFDDNQNLGFPVAFDQLDLSPRTR